MKKIIFFDLDNTIHSTKMQIIPSQTKKLIKELASIDNVYLGLATGRGPSKIKMLEEFIEYFTYKVFINGSIAYKNDELIYKNPLKITDIEAVIKSAETKNISVGMVSEKGEYLTFINNEVDMNIKNFQNDMPKIDPKAYLHTDVYQLWLFQNDQEKIKQITLKHQNLRCYPWHNGGADLVDPNTNKAFAIEKLLKDETNYQLITVGDGQNDVKMIEMADIGIAMANSRFDELKEKADLIAPNIDEDQLYDFFKKNKIII
ncbi:MAG TPA: HAD family phosphatase [Acholeplasmataceae bacterium]|nr:HAD family phosphatase [Acholeplasmataceae bacterium]